MNNKETKRKGFSVNTLCKIIDRLRTLRKVSKSGKTSLRILRSHSFRRFSVSFIESQVFQVCFCQDQNPLGAPDTVCGSENFCLTYNASF